jgi:uncharacterized protein YdaU (DUF1376 family)
VKPFRPWFPLYAADWLSDVPVSLMTMEQEGCYLRLLMAQWREGSLPNDTRALAGIVKFRGEPGHRAFLRSVWPALEPHFRENGDPGRLVNLRLEAIRKEQEQEHSRRSEGGRLGAKKRWDT